MTEATQSKSPCDQMLDSIRTIAVTADLVGVMMMAVELMIEDQKRLMQRGGISSFFCDNELWDGMGTMIATARVHMHDLGKVGEALEVAKFDVEKAA